MIQRYLGKVSGPRLDRIDLHIEVPAVPYREMRDKSDGMSSAEIRQRIRQARAVQQQRGFYNSRIPSSALSHHCALDDAGERTLEMAVRRLGPRRAGTIALRPHDCGFGSKGAGLLVAKDTNGTTVDWIRKGMIRAPYTMAFYGLHVVDDLHHNKTTSTQGNRSQLPVFIDTGATVVDQSNVESSRASAR